MNNNSILRNSRPRPYQPVRIPGVTDRDVFLADKKIWWSEEYARIKEEEKREQQRRARLQAPRKRRTTRYSRSDFEFFDRVEELYGWTKAQLIEHIIKLEDSLEHLQ